MEGSGEKRRRSEKDSEERSTKKKKKKTVSEELERAEEIAATEEEEVEEFFAILKRMQAAVKYFGQGWRTAVESEVMDPDEAAEIVEGDNITGGDDEGNDKDEMAMRKNGERVIAVEEEDQNGVLDLNSVPEGGSHFTAG